MPDPPPLPPTPDYTTLPIKRSRVLPSRWAYPLMLVTAAFLVAAGQELSLALGFFLKGLQNADPSFLFTQLDLCCFVLWSTGFVGLLLILVFTRGAPRVAVGALLATCALAITPLQCEFRQTPLDRYEKGFLQWTSANVHPAPIAAWQATLPPVTGPTSIPRTLWPLAVAALKPSNVIENPGGIILEWGMVVAWGDSRRVFIGANAGVPPPTNDENAAFNWKTLGPGYFAAYQATD
jgi:hypothetical protein